MDSNEKSAVLECSHCGDVAIESADGLFGEDDGDACLSCGMPGRVSVEEDESDYDEGDRIGTASWLTDDGEDSYCTRPDCEECREAGRPEALVHVLSS